MGQVIFEAALRVEQVRDRSVRRNFGYALRLSYESDSDDPPVSAEEIISATSLNVRSAVQLKILVTKRDMAEYLKEVGLAASLTSIRKRVSANSYTKHFRSDRHPVLDGKRLVMTYAEVRHMFGIYSRVRLPPEVAQQLSREGDQ